MKFTKEQEKILSKIETLLPKLAIGRPCRVCEARWKNVPATLIRKGFIDTYPDVEYALPNLIPVCADCSAAENCGAALLPWQVFRELRHKQAKGSFRGRCIAHGLTETQALNKIYATLKEQVLL